MVDDDAELSLLASAGALAGGDGTAAVGSRRGVGPKSPTPGVQRKPTVRAFVLLEWFPVP